MAKGSDLMLQFRKEVLKAAEDLVSAKTTKQIGQEALKIVKRRTKLGYGVPANGARRERLKALSDSYVEQRQGRAVYFTDRLQRVRRVPTSNRFRSEIDLDASTTPRKSNLTLTGTLLDSLKTFVRGRGLVTIEPTGTRPDGKTNKEVSAFVSEERPYLHLSNNEIRQLQQFALDILELRVKKNLTKL